jgi:SdpI/YfhL protein family
MPVLPPDLVLMLLGGLTLFLSLPLLLGLVGPNRFYGIRVAAAFSSERNWYAINRYGAAAFMRFGALVATAGFMLHRYPHAPWWVPIACMVGVLPLLLLTVESIRKYVRLL